MGLLLKRLLMKAEWKEQVLAYKMMTRIQASRAFAGRVFEAMALCQLRKEVALDLVPMERRSASAGALPRWIPQDNVSSSTAMNAGNATNPPISIKFHPKMLITYDSLPTTCLPDVLYMPDAPNQVGFDSFILHNASLFMFQMTIASEHTIKRGIMKTLSHETLKAAKLHSIFVVPPGRTTECLESKDDKLKEFWERAAVKPLFTAEFDRGYTLALD